MHEQALYAAKHSSCCGRALTRHKCMGHALNSHAHMHIQIHALHSQQKKAIWLCLTFLCVQGVVTLTDLFKFLASAIQDLLEWNLASFPRDTTTYVQYSDLQNNWGQQNGFQRFSVPVWYTTRRRLQNVKLTISYLCELALCPFWPDSIVWYFRRWKMSIEQMLVGDQFCIILLIPQMFM